MQYGLLKYDEWNDLLWLYNSIDSPIRTSLTGSLIGIRREDESIQYTHFISKDRNPYHIADGFNQYCGCYDNSINSLGVYEEYLLVGKSKDLFVVSKDGERMLNVLSTTAQYDVTGGGTGHICCSIFPCTLNSSKIVLSSNSNELYFVDSHTGQVHSKLSASIESSGLDYSNDKISVISDFMSNQSNSICSHSYYFEQPSYQQAYYDNNPYNYNYYDYNQQTQFSGNEAYGNNNMNNSTSSNTDTNTNNNETTANSVNNSTSNTNNTGSSTSSNTDSNNKNPRFSFQNVADKYGSVESIPEFVPSSFSRPNSTTNLNLNSYQTNNNNNNFNNNNNNVNISTSNMEAYRARSGSRSNLMGNYSSQSYNHINTRGSNYSERTVGSMSLEFILKELKSPRTLQNDFVDTTCVGMSSGFLHIVDNRANKIVSSINCNNNPVYSISASGNTIATTSCTLYSYSNTYQNQYGNPYSYSNSYSTMMLFEPVVYLHDIRMMRSTSLILEKPVSKLFIVPKTDRLFALSQEGDLFDCKISTLEYTKHQNNSTGGGTYYDLEVTGDSKGEKLQVFVSDSTYSFKRSEFSNTLSQYLDFNLNKLPKNLREIPKSESKNYNNTPFASLVGTFDGDVAHIFVQIFFFLPKLPSIKYHVCEISHCITCQIGFGLHNLQVYYENQTGLDRYSNDNINTNTANNSSSNTNTNDNSTTGNENNNNINNSNNVSNTNNENSSSNSTNAYGRSNKTGKEVYVNKYSNKIIYMTQLQELMLIEKEPSVRTPLNLLLWLIEKINTEMYNYYNKNNYKVTTSLIKDLFSYSKKTETRCSRHDHVNTMVTHNNYYLNYEDLVTCSVSSSVNPRNLDSKEEKVKDSNNTNNTTSSTSGNTDNSNQNNSNENSNSSNNTNDATYKDDEHKEATIQTENLVNLDTMGSSDSLDNLNKSSNSDNKYVMEYCKDCNSTLECKLSVEYLNTPNLLIVDFTSTKVDYVEKNLVFCGNKYNLSSFYFTFPLYKLNYRSLAYIKLPKKYKNNGHEWILVNDGIVMYVDELEEDIFDFTKNWKIPIFAIYTKETVNKKKNTRYHSSRSRKGSSGSLSGNKGSNDEMTTVDLENVQGIVPCINEQENIISVKGRLVPLPYPSLKNPIPSYIFLSEHNIAHNPLAHNKIKTFTPLTIDELNSIQNSNFIFSLDIEYIKSNLTNTCTFHNTSSQVDTRASAHNFSSFIMSEDDDKYLYTLARVSAIRGNDTMYGVPFLDHYILNNKPPKDYMTRFSGIHSGDLELKSSVHWLTTEKLIYLKLRYLIDSGCRVIGHGLEQDFKILNISVPSENIIDTLELFWIPGKRYLSLQFLAHYLLNQRIQQNEHDSIEDAKTALQLYKLYINYKLNNKLKSVIEKLYEIGYQTNWTIK